MHTYKQCIQTVHTYIHTYIHTFPCLGFDEEVHNIINKFKRQRQTVLFSATMPQKFQDFAKVHTYIHTYIHIYIHKYINTYTYIQYVYILYIYTAL